jgi:hypothetical protein
MKKPDQLSEAALSQFTGSETWYRHWAVRNVLYTDGARHVAEAGGAFWLLDEIAFAQCAVEAVAAEGFQVWKLTVDLDRSSGQLVCEDGNGKTVWSKTLDYTDFPVAEVTLWFANDTIYLPSEH